MNRTVIEPGPPIWASDRHCFLTHFCYPYLSSVSSVTSFWMRRVIVRFKKCRFHIQLPYILHLINPFKNKKTTWNCPVLPDIRRSICLYVSKLRPLVLLLGAVLRMKMSVERWWKIEALGGKPVPVPVFQHKSNTSQRTQCSISIRIPSLNTVLGNNRCLF